jgi:hypothetical protein
VTGAVSDREPAAPAETLVDVTWAGRLFALLCAGAGAYVAVVSIAGMRDGRDGAPWLLPLATGALAAVLCAAILPASSRAFLSRRSIGRRALAIALLILYAFVMLPALGFLPSSLIFAAVVAIVYAPRRLAVGLGGAAVAIVLWAVFAYVVAEPLPVGWLWR